LTAPAVLKQQKIRFTKVTAASWLKEKSLIPSRYVESELKVQH